MYEYGNFTSRISILLSFSANCFLSSIISADAGFNLGSKVFITCLKEKNQISYVYFVKYWNMNTVYKISVNKVKHYPESDPS